MLFVVYVVYLNSTTHISTSAMLSAFYRSTQFFLSPLFFCWCTIGFSFYDAYEITIILQKNAQYSFDLIISNFCGKCLFLLLF